MAKCIVIIGMHRSGTSALMGVLNRLGVDLGADFLDPTEDNPKGYFENRDLWQINEKILTSLNSSWDDVFPLPEDWWKRQDIGEHKKAIIEVIGRELHGKKIFGIKDPRISRLFPLWSIIFQELSIEPFYIIPVRNPLEVAGSLRKRDGFTVEKSLILWATYMLDAERYSRPFQRVFVTFDDLLQNAEGTIARISRGLNIDLAGMYAENRAATEEFLDKNLKHHSFGEDGTDLRGAQYIFDYYFLLLHLARVEKAGQDDLRRIDEAEKLLEGLCRIFYPAEIVELHTQLRQRLNEATQAIKERDIHIDAIYGSNAWKLATRLGQLRDNVLVVRYAFSFLKAVRSFFSRTGR